MNTTRRTLAVPVAFAAGSAAALAVVPHPHVDRVVTEAASFVAWAATNVLALAIDLTSALSSSPALAWIAIGFVATIVVAARLAMGWEVHPDEHEGFDIR